MFKTWWFNLILGAMVGLVVGYALAELQPVPPARAMMKGMAGDETGAVPPGHPPVGDAGSAAPAGEDPALAEQVGQLEAALRKRPGDPDLLVALGNLYFDAGRWKDAREAYEAARQSRPDDASLLTDLAVCYRNLHEPERALELLDRAIAIDPGKWQALFNKVVVLHFDLHRHDEARKVLAALERLKQENPQVPDLSGLQKELGGNG